MIFYFGSDDVGLWILFWKMEMKMVEVINRVLCWFYSVLGFVREKKSGSFEF